MVIYFSGTGNSRYAAEVAASETSDEIRDAGRLFYPYVRRGDRKCGREDRRVLQRKRIPLQGNAGSRHAGKLCGIVFGAGGSRVPPADSGCRTEDKRQCQIYP